MIRNMFRPTYLPNAVDIRHLTVKTGLRQVRLKMTTS